MSFPPNKKFFSLIPVIFCILFFSCSQLAPEVKNVSPSIVFDFYNETDTPKARLAVFVESSSNPRRFERIEISNENSDYVWEVENPSVLILKNRMYTGNSNIVLPFNEKLPVGKYIVKCEEKDEDSVEMVFYLNYDKKIYDLNTTEFMDFIKGKGYKSCISIYSSNGNLIYYGDKTEDLSTVRKIFSRYNNAAYYHDIYKRSDDSVICVLPRTEISPS